MNPIILIIGGVVLVAVVVGVIITINKKKEMERLSSRPINRNSSDVEYFGPDGPEAKQAQTYHYGGTNAYGSDDIYVGNSYDGAPLSSKVDENTGLTAGFLKRTEEEKKLEEELARLNKPLPQSQNPLYQGEIQKVKPISASESFASYERVIDRSKLKKEDDKKITAYDMAMGKGAVNMSPELGGAKTPIPVKPSEHPEEKPSGPSQTVPIMADTSKVRGSSAGVMINAQNREVERKISFDNTNKNTNNEKAPEVKEPVVNNNPLFAAAPAPAPVNNNPLFAAAPAPAPVNNNPLFAQSASNEKPVEAKADIAQDNKKQENKDNKKEDKKPNFEVNNNPMFASSQPVKEEKKIEKKEEELPSKRITDDDFVKKEGYFDEIIPETTSEVKTDKKPALKRVKPTDEERIRNTKEVLKHIKATEAEKKSVLERDLKNEKIEKVSVKDTLVQEGKGDGIFSVRTSSVSEETEKSETPDKNKDNKLDKEKVMSSTPFSVRKVETDSDKKEADNKNEDSKKDSKDDSKEDLKEDSKK